MEIEKFKDLIRPIMYEYGIGWLLDDPEVLLKICEKYHADHIKDIEDELFIIKRIEWLKGVTEYTIWADSVPNGNDICDKFELELKQLQNR